MRSYDFINKEWIVSPTARLVYRTAAAVSLTLIPIVLAIQLSGLSRPVLRQLLFLAVLGTALNTIGMEYFLFRFDDSRALKQVFWFCAMFLVPIGPALYCFVVYSRSNALKNSLVDRNDGRAGSAK